MKTKIVIELPSDFPFKSLRILKVLITERFSRCPVKIIVHVRGHYWNCPNENIEKNLIVSEFYEILAKCSFNKIFVTKQLLDHISLTTLLILSLEIVIILMLIDLFSYCIESHVFLCLHKIKPYFKLLSLRPSFLWTRSLLVFTLVGSDGA